MSRWRKLVQELKDSGDLRPGAGLDRAQEPTEELKRRFYSAPGIPALFRPAREFMPRVHKSSHKSERQALNARVISLSAQQDGLLILYQQLANERLESTCSFRIRSKQEVITSPLC
jgi:hypothetical protein